MRKKTFSFDIMAWGSFSPGPWRADRECYNHVCYEVIKTPPYLVWTDLSLLVNFPKNFSQQQILRLLLLALTTSLQFQSIVKKGCGRSVALVTSKYYCFSHADSSEYCLYRRSCFVPVAWNTGAPADSRNDPMSGAGLVLYLFPFESESIPVPWKCSWKETFFYSFSKLNLCYEFTGDSLLLIGFNVNLMGQQKISK